MGPVHCIVNFRRSFLVLSFLLIHQRVMSELTCKPMDTECLVNKTTYFNCSSSIITKEIHWYHYPVGAQAHQRNSVYAFGKLYEDYEKDFALDNNSSDGTYNLVIRSMKPRYAGRYECQDNGGVGNSCSAQLIVLDDEPKCSSNINPLGVIGPNTCGIQPDELQLSCSISYHGIILPELAWYWLGKNDSIRANVTKEQSNGRFTYNLTVKADELWDKSSFECQTTKSRTSKHSCTSETVNLLYIFDASSVSIKNIGEVVNCSANTSSQSCQYNWYDKDNTLMVANNRILKIGETGQHRCEATCDLRNVQCTVIATMINATQGSGGAGSETTDTSYGVVVGMVLSLLVVTIVIVAIFLWFRYKRNYSRRGCYDEGAVLSNGLEQSGYPLLAKNRRPEITDYELHAELLHVESLRPANMDKTLVTGLTLLSKELFVAFENKSDVVVFQTIAFNYLRTIAVKELDNPLDMVSSPTSNCLYISSPNKIYRLDTNGNTFPKWPIEDGDGTLSVTHDQTVILSDWKNSALREYSADGKLIREIKLPSDVHPFHAVKIRDNQFVVGLQHGKAHKVASVDTNGTIKSFCEIYKFPKYLNVNSDGYIFAAYLTSRCLLMIRPTLDSAKVLLSGKDQLDRPSRICLDERNRQIFVADNKSDNIRFMVFKLERCERGTNEDIVVNQTNQTKLPESNHNILTGDMGTNGGSALNEEKPFESNCNKREDPGADRSAVFSNISGNEEEDEFHDANDRLEESQGANDENVVNQQESLDPNHEEMGVNEDMDVNQAKPLESTHNLYENMGGLEDDSQISSLSGNEEEEKELPMAKETQEESRDEEVRPGKRKREN